MSLRMRRGGWTETPAPEGAFGPTLGELWVIDNAGIRPTAITEPVVPHTTLVPANSVAANQALLTADATGVIWWPLGTYAMTTTGYSIKAGLKNYLQSPGRNGTRDATDTALLSMSSTSATAVLIAGANVEWHGGIIHGGGYGMTCSSGGVADNFLIEDAELRYAYETCYKVAGAWVDSNPLQTEAGWLKDTTIRHCLLHHGGRHNAHLFYVAGLTWEYNESHHGNDRSLDYTAPDYLLDDTSGLKILEANYTGKPVVFRYNYDHHHNGEVWFDTRVNNCTVEESVFADNYRMGFFSEDNSTVLVQRSLFRDNGITHAVGAWGQGYMGNIDIARSNAVEVTACDFVTTGAVTHASQHDIRVLYQLVGINQTKNTWIHHNRFQRSKAPSTNGGIISTYLSSENVCYDVNYNRCDSNEYHVPTGTTTSDWFVLPGGLGGDSTWTQWQAGASVPFAGSDHYDPNGTFTGDL